MCRPRFPERSVMENANLPGMSLKAYFAPSAHPLRNGGARMLPIRTERGTFRVWTKRCGQNPRLKLLLLHGGPGATHEYFEVLEPWLGSEGIEFIYYDQLGSAYSDQPQDEALWTTERFVEEVEQVRQVLGLGPNDFHLLGHSWGGILALEYALKHGNQLKSLIVSNMMASVPDYNRYVRNVLAPLMVPGVLAELEALEAAGDFQNPRYESLLRHHFYAWHVCRLPEWPEPVLRSFSRINRTLYALMQGPSEFGASGRLADWDCKARLPRLTMPVLTIGARHDTMDPEHVRWMAGQVARGRHLYCPDGSHLAMWDDQEVYARGLIRFLKAVEAGVA